MSLPELLSARMGERTVVVGIGNPHRGDDVVGCLVAHALRRRPGLRVVEAEDVPEAFLGTIVHPIPDTVILVDALDLGEAPGTVAFLEVGEVATREASTHRAPLSLLARYIQAETGADVFVLGVQPGERGIGGPPSEAVRHAAVTLAAVLRKASSSASAGRHPESEAEIEAQGVTC